MTWIRSEEEVDRMIESMIKKSNGKYITQGVAFNKDSERQLELLKMVLMHSGSFSGFVKEMLAKEFGGEMRRVVSGSQFNENKTEDNIIVVEKKNTGNFL